MTEKRASQLSALQGPTLRQLVDDIRATIGDVKQECRDGEIRRAELDVRIGDALIKLLLAHGIPYYLDELKTPRE